MEDKVGLNEYQYHTYPMGSGVNQEETMTQDELREKITQVTKIYDEAILSALGIDDRTFFQLPIYQRERYVQLTKGLLVQILALIKEALPELTNPLILELKDIESMGHYHVIRDWTIKLKNGKEIDLGADIVKEILGHETKEAGGKSSKIRTSGGKR